MIAFGQVCQKRTHGRIFIHSINISLPIGSVCSISLRVLRGRMAFGCCFFLKILWMKNVCFFKGPRCWEERLVILPYVWICGIFPSHCKDVEINRTIKLNTQTRTTYVRTHKARQLFPFIYFRAKNSPHIYRTKNHNSSKIKSRNGTEWHIFSNDAFK